MDNSRRWPPHPSLQDNDSICSSNQASVNHPSVDRTTFSTSSGTDERIFSELPSWNEKRPVSRWNTRASPSPPLAEALPETRSYHEDPKRQALLSRHERSYNSEPAYHLLRGAARMPHSTAEEEIRSPAQTMPRDHSFLSSHQESLLDEASALHRRKLSALDEKYNDKVTALDLRLKLLELELQKSNLPAPPKSPTPPPSELPPPPPPQPQEETAAIHHGRPINKGVQTSPMEHPEMEKVTAAREKYASIEALMNELGAEDAGSFRDMIDEWRVKAQLFSRLRGFIDRVDQITWETPYVPLLSVCHQHKQLAGILQESSDDLCESHRVQYEKALLEAHRERVRADDADQYSNERLEATFERLVRWSHTVRHTT